MWSKAAKRFAFSLLSVAFWIFLWFVLAFIANQNLLLKIPLPSDTVKALIRCVQKSSFWQAVIATVGHILGGFVCAALLGIIGGVLSGNSTIFRIASSPLLHAIRAVPVAAFVILAWLWIPASVLPAFIAGLMVMPIIWSHVEAGLQSVDPKLIEMGKSYGMSRWQLISEIKVPWVLPHVRTGCITGLGIAWKAGVAAEIICNPTGSIGALLQRAKVDIEYDEVFAITLAVVLLSLLFENILKAIWRERKYE